MKGIEDIKSLLSKLEDRAAELEGYETLLTGIETALTDIVGLLDKPREKAEPLDLSPLIEAIKGLKLSAGPVNVSPTPIEVHVPAQPTPIVNVEAPESWKSLEVKVNRGKYGGAAESYTITKLT